MLDSVVFVFFFKQKTAYEMRISDWSSDVCSSDLVGDRRLRHSGPMTAVDDPEGRLPDPDHFERRVPQGDDRSRLVCRDCGFVAYENPKIVVGSVAAWQGRILLCRRALERSEEHTSELQPLMRISYAVFCLK